jgi:tRNA nucleotidyltransferase (CCA-adding enzyme)
VSVVGGAVRDALLGRPDGPDVDLVVEGDALPLARRLGEALGARVTTHERFGTAEVPLPHGPRLDLVTARRERYPSPGALPEVEPADLLADLARRDITVNAMALRLSGPGAGELVDPHGGLADLRAGVVRALSAGSFAEDPSRAVRAARYAARLGFAVDPATREAARAAAEGLDPASARVADEVQRLLEEPTAAEALRRLADLGAGWVAAAEDLDARFAALDAALRRRGAPALPAWALRLGLALEPSALARAAVPGWARAIAAEAARGEGLAAELAGATSPSALDDALRRTPPATAVAALAAGADPVARWWAEWRDAAPPVGGADLVAAGVPPGPGIGRALREVRAAWLDGRVRDRDALLALALEVARR